MSPHELALARSRTWAMLGHLLLEGPTDRIAAWVGAVPELRAEVGDASADDRAVRHEAALGQGVPPYASVFLGDRGQLGGDVVADIRARLDGAGFRARVPGVEDDHVGVSCLAMAFLCEAEAEALTDDVDPEPVREAQARVSTHLLGWLPALAVALQRQGDALYATAATMAVELGVSHDVRGEAALPQPLDVLDEPRAGLAAVAKALLVPGRTGWFLSRAVLLRIAADTGLPCGFGPRWKMLESFLVTAREHDRVADAIAALDGEAAAWVGGMAALENEGAHVAAWRERLAVTREALRRIEAAATA